MYTDNVFGDIYQATMKLLFILYSPGSFIKNNDVNIWKSRCMYLKPLIYTPSVIMSGKKKKAIVVISIAALASSALQSSSAPSPQLLKPALQLSPLSSAIMLKLSPFFVSSSLHLLPYILQLPLQLSWCICHQLL